ncbi:MAG: ABC transporter ATP-binding protein/permease [Treponema sp.]|nr:ABC transporter ATP-binding protein/permease [Treponema sp.]
MIGIILKYTGKYKKYTLLSMIMMFVAMIFYTIPFVFVYQIIEGLVSNVLQNAAPLSFNQVAVRIAGVFICLAMHAFLYVKGLGVSHFSAYQTLKQIRLTVQAALEKKPLGIIQDYGSGKIKKLFCEDIESVELILAHFIPEGFANLFTPIIVIIAMLIIDWRMGLLCIATLPIGMFAMSMMFKAGMRKMNAYYKSAAVMNNTIIEYINGMEVVKVFNRDGESYRRFENDVNSYRDFTLDWYKECWPWMAIYSALIPCTVLLALPVGSLMVMHGATTLSKLILILCLSSSVGGPLLKAMSFMGKIPQVAKKVSEIEAITHEKDLIQGGQNFKGKDYSIDFENVTFAYKEKNVLKNVSLHIPQGGMTALVGESGGGKSTLAKLLVHFYDVKEGHIKIGGQDITDMSIEALNSQISYVAQEQFLFNTTIKENIRLGKLDATDEEIMQAAEKAQCKDFLERLPNGLDTPAGDGGKMLSGGERQRISLARAILKNAPIVVFDEATAFMDPENEEKMNDAIAEVIKGKTVIVIAHRLHSIVNADNICVIKGGNLIASGTQSKLLAESPEYRALWDAAQGTDEWAVTGNDKEGESA